MIIRTIKKLDKNVADILRKSYENTEKIKEIFSKAEFLNQDNTNIIPVYEKVSREETCQMINKYLTGYQHRKYRLDYREIGSYLYETMPSNILLQKAECPIISLNTQAKERKDGRYVYDADIKIYRYQKHMNLQTEFETGDLTGLGFNRVIDIIRFFFDKKRLYNESLEFIKIHEKKLTKILGISLTKDYMSLFSAKWLDTVDIDFNLPEENKDKFLIYKYESNDDYKKGKIHLAGFSGIIVSPKEKELKNHAKSIQLLLGNNNELTIDIVFEDKDISFLKKTSLTSKNYEEILKDTTCSELININLETWLKDTIILSNFSSGVFQEVKSKILLEKI